MPAELFYVRVRGTVTGPFDLPALQKQVRQGVLARIHHISRDKIQWESAGQFEDLFPLAGIRTPVPVPSAAGASPPVAVGAAAPSGDSPQPQSTGAAGLYYELHGTVSGPVPSAVVESMAINGVISGDTPVWAADGHRLAARDHPLLGNIRFPEGDGPVSTDGGGPRTRKFMSVPAMALTVLAVAMIGGGIYAANRMTAKQSDNNSTSAVPAVSTQPAPVIQPQKPTGTKIPTH